VSDFKAKVKRLRKSLDRDWEKRQRAALDWVQKVQDTEAAEGVGAWEDRTVRDVVNLEMAKSVGSERRAREQGAGGKTTFAVMLMQPRVEDHAAWERMAAEEERKARAIPAQELSGELGAKRELQEQLGEDFPPGGKAA